MQTTDVAISAAGSTLYELCAAQIPTITYILAENQVTGAREFHRRGLMMSVGDIRELGVDRLTAFLLKMTETLANNYESRKRMSEIMKKALNPNGAAKIVETILSDG